MGQLRVGIVGEQQRRQGDIFADTVNVANRIEGMTKTYGANLIVSAEFLAALSDSDVLLPLRRPLGPVFVKGRSEAVLLYECFEFDGDALQSHKRATRAQFERAQELVERGLLAEAVAVFESIQAANPADVAARYLYRQLGSRLEKAGQDA
jgi:hypothetical protein